MDDKALKPAREAIERGDLALATELLLPLVSANNPTAIYLSSCYARTSESDEEFEMRRFWLLHKAAQLGDAESLYVLGVVYDSGDGVIRNSEIASIYFSLAASVGHARAKLSHGLDLYYGSNRVQRDEVVGRQLIAEAAALGVEGAIEALRKLDNL